MDPAARGLNEHLDLQECTPEEYKESLEFVTSKDAIMDTNVFTHLKKVTSYQFNQLLPQNSNRSDFAATRSLNREALNMLVEGYEGYAWLCQAAAEVFNSLEEAEKGFTSILNETEDHNKIIYKGLCEQLVTSYNTSIMRRFMDQERDHGSWNPPDFYWQLMKNPIIISQMLKLYHEKPKDEFLACWFQDYIHQSRLQAALPPELLTKEQLSKLTSNFNVFTLRMSEEISKYLFKDLRTEFDDVNPDNICQLFCYAENAYFYSQALLHFIVRWRPDFSGCRRLSQLLCKNVMNPPSYWIDINKREKEYSASQINLLMTNLSKYKRLYNIFRSISRTQVDGKIVLQCDEVCEFYDTLKFIVESFESYQTLLYERPTSHHKLSRITSNTLYGSSGNTQSSMEPNQHLETENTSNSIRDSNNESNNRQIEQEELHEDKASIVDMPSASQYGGDNHYWQEEYMRIRNAPEMPPMEALRESGLLESLLEDFVDDRVLLTQNQAWVKYAELLIILTVYSPYEMLLKWEESKQIKKAEQQGYHGLWKYDFMADDYESSDEETYLSNDNGDLASHEALDNLFEKPEHHLPGSSFRDPSRYLPTDELNFYGGFDESHTVNKRHFPESAAIPKKRGRWDTRYHSHTSSTHKDPSNDYYDKIELQTVVSDSPSITSSDTDLSSADSESVGSPSEKVSTSESNSESNFMDKTDETDKSDLHDEYNKNECFTMLDLQTNNNQAQSYVDSNSNLETHTRNQYNSNYGSGKRAPPNLPRDNFHATRTSDYNYSITDSDQDSEDESQISPSTIESESQLSIDHYHNFEESLKYDKNDIPTPITNNRRYQVKNSSTTNKYQNDSSPNESDENYVRNISELDPSVLVSSIYKDAMSGKKLGIKKSISIKKNKKLKEQFSIFKDEFVRYSNVARKELFEIYKISRDRLQNINVKIYNFQSLLKTNIAASATLKYIEYYLFQISPDPLASLSDAILLLLKMVADYHAPQIMSILLLLKKLFETGNDSIESNFRHLHSNTRSKIITFFIYLCRFENEFISVMTIVNKLVYKMDKSMIRSFLLLLFKHCGPPYSSDFCRPLLKFLETCIELSIFESSDKDSTVEQKRFRKVSLQFLENARHSDQPKITPIDVIQSIEELIPFINDKNI